MIKVKNLVKKYGDFVAVNDISFDVKRGDVVGLLGPNGAGKTTTMKILTCFMPATSGEISVGGFDVFLQSLQVRGLLGYMPENVPLYPEMRVREFLEYRGKLKGVTGNKLKKRIEEIVDCCQLGQVRNRIIEQLSKGNKQRVGLADALISDPDLLILDEPTIGLDPNQVIKVRNLIKELSRDRTIILSTHILPEVELVCEHVIIMYHGKIVAQESMSTMRSGAKKQYVCEAKLSKPDLEHTLAKIPEAMEIRAEVLSEGWCRATFKSKVPDLDLRETVYNTLSNRNAGLRQLNIKMPTLEDIFVEVTTKDNV